MRVQVVPVRWNTNTRPPPLAKTAGTSAMFASVESTPPPKASLTVPPEGSWSVCCGVHVLPERTEIETELPSLSWTSAAAKSAVFPSDESELPVKKSAAVLFGSWMVCRTTHLDPARGCRWT
jgi:hypothetical protein